jgi:dolichol-phosphate mannosyltransferase/undecaprenyl-phosphate 4-deoxy-4-formamido-L-arabinose transferase
VGTEPGQDHSAEGVLLSVVVPVYGSAPMLVELHERLQKALDEITPDWEIVFVEDASPDEAWEVLEELAARDSRVRAIQLMRNYGQQRAVLCGLAHSRGELVVTMDDDLQHRPEEIALLYDAIRDGDADVVVGRYRQKQHGWHRRLGTHLVRWLAQKTIGVPRSLSLTSFRIMRRCVAREVVKLDHSNPVVGYLLFAVTRRVRNVDVHHDVRKLGGSSYSLKGLVDYFLCMVIDYSDWPLRAVGGSGFLLSLGSFALGAFYLYRWSTGAITVSGFTTLVLLLTFLSGFVLTGIGIIGSYLVRVLRRGGPESRIAIRTWRNEG